ncbi:MAG: hypothetical protein AB1568_11905 [Thermodesulfobacteriota bacterium]
MNKRWYDQYGDFGRCLDGLKDTNRWDRDRLIRGIMELIREHSPDLLDRFVLEFPLDISRKRWYDKDPYMWLLMNGLRYADAPLRDRITAYLLAEYGHMAEQASSS